MPYYQNYTFTTANQFVIDLATFAAANGWTIDFNAVYLTSYQRLHLHKGIAHFELRSYSNTGVYLSACTGYGGTSPAAQPGYWGVERVIANTSGSPYYFVSTQNGLYFTSADTTYKWGALFLINKKIGSWTEGFGAMVPSGSNLFGNSCCHATYGGAMIFYNGSWSTLCANNVLGGAFVGNYQTSWVIPSVKQPNVYNAGLMPCPVLLMLVYAADTTKRVPIGFAPELFATNGGVVYNPWDEIIIGADTYVIVPSSNLTLGLVATGDHLFKLGA